MQSIVVDYGVAYTADLDIYITANPEAVAASFTPASGDTKISTNRGVTFTNTTNTCTFANGIISVVLTSTELQAARIILKFQDQDAALVNDKVIELFTKNHASAFYTGIDLATDSSGYVTLSAATHTGAVIPTVTTLTGHTAQTGDNYARIGAAGASLTNINLPNQTMDIIGDITGNLSGSVGSVTGHTVQTGDTYALANGTDGFVAISAQIDNIGAASGGSLNIEATSDNTGGAIIDAVTFVGSVQGATTYTNTESEDGILHDIDDTGDDIDIVYGFAIGGGRTATEVNFSGFCQGSSDEMKIKVYDHVGSAWDIIGTLLGTNGTTNTTLDLPLLSKHSGTGAEVGNVYVRFDTDSTTPSNLSVDKLLVSAVNIGQSVGYAEGAIWLDGNVSNENTESFVDGVADNPVKTWAAALTLSTAIGINKFNIAAGTTITLSANSDNYILYGEGWTLALGGQSIDAATFIGAHVTGIGEATTSHPHFTGCYIGAATIPPSIIKKTGFGDESGQFTAASAGEYVFHECYSLVPGSGSPALVFTGLGPSTGINNRGWNGGATYTLDSNCTLSHEVREGGGTTITTGGADCEVRGITRDFTVIMSAAETVQFVGITDVITLSGTTTATVNLAGISSSVADSTSAATVTDSTVNSTSQAAILADTNSLNDTKIPDTISLANINGEVVDVLKTDTISEMAQGKPTATPTFEEAVMYLYTALRNKIDVTATTKEFHNDAGTVIWKKALSDNGTTYTEAEGETGP